MQIETVLHSRAQERDRPRVAIPYPQVQIVARFGTSARNGLDVHVLGPRETVHRKLIRGGQWALISRLPLGASTSVLGLPASRIPSSPTPLEDFWGSAAATRLLDQLASAQGHRETAAALDRAIHERIIDDRSGSQALVLAAADRLKRESVSAVALQLSVSERHLRRVFRDLVGVSPKTFASLARFRRAIRTARDGGAASWAAIAASAGYYDQAHLIAEFRAIAGVTPRALLRELDG